MSAYIISYIEEIQVSPKTKASYFQTLNRLEILGENSIKKLITNERKLYNIIKGLDVSESTKNKYISVVYSYIKFNKIDTKLNLFKNLISDLKNQAFNKPIENENKQKPREYYQELFHKANFKDDDNSKLILSLNLFHSVLRTDLANVKIKNYEKDEPYLLNGIIYFPTINKTDYKDITIKLTKDELKLVDLSKEYLLDIQAQNRNNSYSKIIKKITFKYLGESLTANDLRRIDATNKVNNIDENLIKKLGELDIKARESGHTLTTLINHYYNK